MSFKFKYRIIRRYKDCKYVVQFKYLFFWVSLKSFDFPGDAEICMDDLVSPHNKKFYVYKESN